MKKKCTKCGGIKEEAEFHRRRKNYSKRHNMCKICQNVYHQQWRKKNPQKRVKETDRLKMQRGNFKRRDPTGYRRFLRRSNLKRKYGLSIEQYDVIALAQNNLCAICGQPETMMHDGELAPLAVDHDHKANKNRALLCRKCNSILGYSQDDPIRLRKAAAYLEFHKK